MRFASSGFALTIGQLLQAIQQLVFFLQSCPAPVLESPPGGAGLKVPDVTEDHGAKRRRVLAPTGPGDVDLSAAPHAVGIKKGSYSVAGFPAALKPEQLIQKVAGFALPQIRDDLGMRADHIGDIQQRQAHFRVMLFGADCESVSAAFFSPSHAFMLR